jgi:chemotaxis protein MotB
MKCSKCQEENREDAKFCKECGAELEFACSQCGAVHQLKSKFCDECGYQLDQKIKADKPAPSHDVERKHITVLFLIFPVTQPCPKSSIRRKFGTRNQTCSEEIIMRNQRFFFSVCLACLLISACVSKEKYEELEATLADARAKLEQNDKNIGELAQKLEKLEKDRDKCRSDNSALSSRYQDLEQKQQMLSQTLAQKEDIIYKADEAKRQVETGLQLQIDNRDKKIRELENTVAELNQDRRQFEDGLQAQIETREQKIKELEDAVAKLDETRRMLELNLLAQLENREKRIMEQRKRISELDNRKQHVETNLIDLKEQMAIQDKTINEQKKIIAELDSARLKIENSLQDRASEIEFREKRIKELQDAVAQRDKAKHQIETDLQEQIKSQQVKLEKLADKLKVTFVDRILFNSGSTRITEKGKQLLSTLAESLKQNNQHIIVEGHTDSVPIGPELRRRYPTNWELSVARSAAVVRYLTETAGIAPARLTASGHSFYEPVASNATEDGRRQNRRIEIIMAFQR